MSKNKRSSFNRQNNRNGDNSKYDGLFNGAGRQKDPNSKGITKSDKPPLDLTLKRPVRYKTPNQQAYLESIRSNDITFCTGQAGCGKTHLAVGMAATYLSKGLIDRIIVVRPMICTDEELGILPGGVEDKLGPYLVPVYDEFLEFFTESQLDAFGKGKYPIIRGAPLGTLKGRNFKKAVVILDEAQDATYAQLKTFITRLCEGSKIIIVGDPNQSDRLRDSRTDITPLEEIMHRLEDGDVEGVGICRLLPVDNQRHPRMARILECI
jgi:phosphate starvation-inducible PhoH-like protein